MSSNGSSSPSSSDHGRGRADSNTNIHIRISFPLDTMNPNTGWSYHYEACQAMWDSLQRALDTVSVGYDRIAVIDLLQRAGKVPSEEEQAFVDNFDAAQGELDEKIPILSRWISRLEARERQAFCDLNPEVVGRYNILVAPDPDRSHINN